MWSKYYQLKLSNIDNLIEDFSQLYLFGIPSALIIFSALYLPIKIPKLLVYLGDASYSIYLIHGTVLSLLIKIVLKLNQSELFSNLLGAIVLFMGTIIISCIFYSLIEKNLLKLLNKSYKKSLK
jgi:peptidoglycan/LPS O-acetylase OafA/YrhL